MAGELTSFLEEREDRYRRLEYLLYMAEKNGLRKFDKDDLVELGHLYRIAAADLARARFVLRSPILAEYLNELVGRAHHMIHRKSSNIIKSFIWFVAYDFPMTFRKELNPILLAISILVGAALVGGISYQFDHKWGQLMLADPNLRQYEADLRSGPAHLASGDISEDAMAAASGFIITNNIQACTVASAGGILFGLGTFFALSSNGFLLGVIGSMYLSKSFAHQLYFWAGILPHGVLELPAICIAGGAGFLFARGLLIPGKISRGEALRLEGVNAVKLIGGVILLLIIAGLIEGFITPIPSMYMPHWLKLIFAACLFTGLVLYLSRSGLRGEDKESVEHARKTTTHLRLE